MNSQVQSQLVLTDQISHEAEAGVGVPSFPRVVFTNLRTACVTFNENCLPCFISPFVTSDYNNLIRAIFTCSPFVILGMVRFNAGFGPDF